MKKAITILKFVSLISVFNILFILFTLVASYIYESKNTEYWNSVVKEHEFNEQDFLNINISDLSNNEKYKEVTLYEYYKNKYKGTNVTPDYYMYGEDDYSEEYGGFYNCTECKYYYNDNEKIIATDKILKYSYHEEGKDLYNKLLNEYDNSPYKYFKDQNYKYEKSGLVFNDERSYYLHKINDFKYSARYYSIELNGIYDYLLFFHRLHKSLSMPPEKTNFKYLMGEKYYAFSYNIEDNKTIIEYKNYYELFEKTTYFKDAMASIEVMFTINQHVVYQFFIIPTLILFVLFLSLFFIKSRFKLILITLLFFHFSLLIHLLT